MLRIRLQTSRSEGQILLAAVAQPLMGREAAIQKCAPLIQIAQSECLLAEAQGFAQEAQLLVVAEAIAGQGLIGRHFTPIRSRPTKQIEQGDAGIEATQPT
jgi:hypothetical protein